MAKRFWAELKSSEFAGLDPNATVAILPVASTEQHGPHLPVMTDTAIAEGLIKTVLARLPGDLHVLLLPTQTIGKSDEHLRSGGTITHSADNLVRSWFEIGEGVHRAGLRKMVIANSHGGNNRCGRHRNARFARTARHAGRRDTVATASVCLQLSIPPSM